MGLEGRLEGAGLLYSVSLRDPGCGDVSGNVSGCVSGDVSGCVSGDVSGVCNIQDYGGLY